MPLIVTDTVFDPLISEFIADARAASVDGFTLAEIGELFVEFIDRAVAAAAMLANPGTEKKAVVLAAVGVLFDNIAPAIPLPMIVQPFRVFIRPYVRQLVIALAGGVIEVSYSRLKKGK